MVHQGIFKYVSTGKYYKLGSHSKHSRFRKQKIWQFNIGSLDLLLGVATGNSCQIPLKNMYLKKTHSCITMNSTKYSNMLETISNKWNFQLTFQQIYFHYKWRFCMYCITYGNCVTSIMNNHVFQSSLLIIFCHKSKPCNTLSRLS